MPKPILKVAAFGDSLVNETKIAFWGDVKEWIGQHPALTGAAIAAPIGAMVGAKTTPEEEPERKMTRAALGGLLAGAGGALLGKAVLPRLAGTGRQAPSPAPQPSAPSGPSPAEGVDRVTGSPVRPAAAEPPSVTSRALTPGAAESRLRSSDQVIRQQAQQQQEQVARQAIEAKEKASMMRDQVRTQMRAQQMLQPQSFPMPGSPRGFITITPGPGVRQIAGPGMPAATPKVPGMMGGQKYASLRDLTSSLSGAALFKQAAGDRPQSMLFGGLNTPGTETDTTQGDASGNTTAVMFGKATSPLTVEDKYPTKIDELGGKLVPWPGASGVRVHAEDVR